ncbi:MAG TPA: hypothetical protein VHK47_21165 [Polyangia bacterium]|jgi:hypothetical protein|nr:hypothetical protein [Polyangia bacterium]
MDLLVPPGNADHAVASDGEAFIWRPSEHVVIQQAAGVLSLALAELFGDFYRPILVPGTRIEIFDDFERLRLYTKDAREYLTNLTLERLSTIETIHFLLTSKLLALGVSAFKHQIGDERVTIYAERASFLRSYERAVAR